MFLGRIQAEGDPVQIIGFKHQQMLPIKSISDKQHTEAFCNTMMPRFQDPESGFGEPISRIGEHDERGMTFANYFCRQLAMLPVPLDYLHGKFPNKTVESISKLTK